MVAKLLIITILLMSVPKFSVYTYVNIYVLTIRFFSGIVLINDTLEVFYADNT
jgi:hypothetical protein